MTLAAARRVGVPRDVRLDRVEPHEAGLADAVGPLVGVHAEVVHRTGEDAVRLPVEQEVVGPMANSGMRRYAFRSVGETWRAGLPAAGRTAAISRGETAPSRLRSAAIQPDGEALLVAVVDELAPARSRGPR